MESAYNHGVLVDYPEAEAKAVLRVFRSDEPVSASEIELAQRAIERLERAVKVETP